MTRVRTSSGSRLRPFSDTGVISRLTLSLNCFLSRNVPINVIRSIVRPDRISQHSMSITLWKEKDQNDLGTRIQLAESSHAKLKDCRLLSLLMSASPADIVQTALSTASIYLLSMSYSVPTVASGTDIMCSSRQLKINIFLANILPSV